MIIMLKNLREEYVVVDSRCNHIRKFFDALWESTIFCFLLEYWWPCVENHKNKTKEGVKCKCILAKRVADHRPRPFTVMFDISWRCWFPEQVVLQTQTTLSFTKVLAVLKRMNKMMLEPSFVWSGNYWWCTRIWLDIRAKVNSYITVVSLIFLSVLQYNINMMAELEFYPKKPEEGDKVIEQKPQKRKYKKSKPLDVETIYVVKGDIFLDFQWITEANASLWKPTLNKQRF